jgi:acetyl-CoA acetyltransferase
MNTKRITDEVSVAGAGQARYSKVADRTIPQLIHEAASAALENAGLEWGLVDGLALTSFLLPPDNCATISEQFGLEPRFLFQGLYGGASGIIGLSHAARAIADGACEVVVVAAADAFDVASHNNTLDHFNGSVRDFMSPQGFGGANGMFALHTRLYMERYGATAQDFGKFCIALRSNAALNPNALLRREMSLEDYLNAKKIADPLRLYDCVMPCIGADAVVVVSERIAKRIRGPRVRILAAQEIHNAHKNDLYSHPGGWDMFRDALYERAGVGPSDLDFAQIYDDYPVMAFHQIEGLGIADPGKTAQLIEEKGITTRGQFPVNTGGGQLSAGQAGASGGMIGLYEAVTQLRGDAAERQVKCRTGVATGYGMVAYGRGLCSSAVILQRG